MTTITVVHKKSTLEFYSKSPDKDVQEYVNSGSVFAQDMIEGADAHERSLDKVVNSLIKQGETFNLVYRGDLPKMPEEELAKLFSADEVVLIDAEKRYLSKEIVAVGGDGTTIETSHYVRNAITPVFIVNSDPTRSTGFYSTSTSADFYRLFSERDKLPKTVVSRIEAEINGTKIKELVLNDILIAHELPAATTRYHLVADGVEMHEKPPKDSGLLICTPAGFSGWMIKLGGRYLPLDSKEVQFCGRDNFEIAKQAENVYVLSLTRRGVAYVDGDYNAYSFGLNSEMRMMMGTPLLVYGNLETRRKQIVKPMVEQELRHLEERRIIALENLAILTDTAQPSS